MKKRQILLSGGTGFIGRALIPHLHKSGFEVSVLSRSAQAFAGETDFAKVQVVASLDELDPTQPWYGIVNLAGEALDSARWNTAVKTRLIASRVQMTESLNRWVQTLSVPLDVLVSGSAIGWYGHWQDEALDEESAFSSGFSHDLCEAWERSALENSAKRICRLRTGVVLGPGGGPLAAMLPAARLGLGGAMGSGQQWWSWIHVDDLCRLIVLSLERDDIDGIINGTAPEPVRQQVFARTLGKVLGRPAVLPMPGRLAKLILGEFAEEILLRGQRVLPAKAQSAGFEFRYPELSSALEDILL